METSSVYPQKRHQTTSYHLTKKGIILSVLWIIIVLFSTTFAQSLESPPTRFAHQPQSGTAHVQGNTKVMLCLANAVPSAVYSWRHDDIEVWENNKTEGSLRLESLQRVNSGEYQCTASNYLGALLSDRAHVHVAYLVPFTSGPVNSVNVELGRAVIIQLPPIDSYPAPTLQWYSGDALIQPSSRRFYVTLGQQLVVLAATSSDNSKEFHAKAISLDATTSESRIYQLQVQGGSRDGDVGPEMVIAPRDTTVLQGVPTAVLECVINARPLNYLSIKWYRLAEDGSRTLLEANFRYLLSTYARTLTIRNPFTPDTGRYECVGTFSAPGDPNSPSVAAQANLTVYEAPTFLQPPPQSDMVLELGTSALIPCQAAGIPTPTVTWYRNARPLVFNEQSRMRLISARDLQIEDLAMTDSGIFQCFATSEAGEINAATWLRVVSSSPNILVAPSNQSTVTGTSVRLECEVSGAPKPTVVWTKEDASGTVQEVSGDGERVVVSEGELLIRDTQRADTGLYTCTATNSMGQDSAQARLIVITRTRIVSPPQDAAYIKGSTTQLLCGVEHDPGITVTWTWLFNQAELTGDFRRIIQDDGSLQIRSIRNSDIGTYRCHVTSTGGDDSAQANITVIELPYSPVITNAVLSSDEPRAVELSWTPGFDGNSPILKFTVEYRLAPPGQILFDAEGWILADTDIPAARRSYTVRGLQPAQYYEFRVAAVNDVGEGQGSAPSRVIQIPQEPPSGPPLGVVGSPRSDSSILLQWQRPSPDHWNGVLLGYSVRYKPANYPDSTLSFEEIPDPNDGIYELSGLIVFQEYEIAVAAYNGEGIGVYSPYVRVRTQEGVPTRAPTALNASALNSTSVSLAWNPPDSQFIYGINQGYKIEAVRTDIESGDSPLLVAIPSDTSNLLGRQSAVVTGLSKYSTYRLRVLCFTSKGDGPYSNPVAVQTLEDVPDEVGSLEFRDIRDTSVTVVWTPPHNLNGILTGYTLRYMLKGQELSAVTRLIGANVTQYVIDGLTPSTQYSVEIFASTRAGDGPVLRADIDSGIPPERPEPPSQLALTNIEASSVLVQFLPGFSGYTSISRWIVEAQIGTRGATRRARRQTLENDAAEIGSDWQVVFEISAPDETSFVVTNLRPYTRYRLRVLAENLLAVSAPSEPTRWFDTKQASPAQPPADVSVRAVDTNSVRVTWTPLPAELWNGEDTGYRVQVTRGSSNSYEMTRDIADPHANSLVLQDLHEYMLYTVRVAAYNNVGVSHYSALVSDTTRQAVPSAGPEDVGAEALNSTSIRVHWGQVLLLDQNGLITSYGILYQLVSEPNATVSEVLVEGANNSVALITELKKYREYQLQVRAYTIGPGALSSPPIILRTFEDVPGPPSSVYFPEVTWTTARIVWSPPMEPNGVITHYRVAYRQASDSENSAVVDDQIDASVHEKYLSGLTRDKYYVFSVTARTGLGWGEPAELRLRTVVNRRAPDPPSRPSIQQPQIGDRHVTMQWQPGNDNYSPIRNFTIQLQRDTQPWQTLPHHVPHHLTIYTITGLKPNTDYRFRIAATNDVGTSDYSPASDRVTTKQAAPESPPQNVTVTPQTRTSVLVTWQPVETSAWNGVPLGYQVWYVALAERDTVAQPENSLIQRTGPDTTQALLTDLEIFMDYQVKVSGFNAMGSGPTSAPQIVFVGEAVPTAAPRDVTAQALSSRQIELTWTPPPEQEQNGDLQGYKIFYWESGGATDTGMETQVVGGDVTRALLSDLRIYTTYSATLLAFNAAGEGPNATSLATATTLQDKPGEPGPLQFTVTSSTSVNVSWAHPEQANGVITLYNVAYSTVSAVNGERRNVSVDVEGQRRHYYATALVEGVRYVFSVKARTAIGWGLPRNGEVFMGPQEDSPEAPSDLRVDMRSTSIRLEWTNGAAGSSPVRGYIIQAFRRGGDEWEDAVTSFDAEPRLSLPISNLRTNAQYRFRVIALNSHGPSPPSEPSAYHKIEDKSNEKPFYQQWWFLVIVALLGVIFIILVVSLLCLTGRRHRAKHKHKDPLDRMPRTTLQLSSTLPSAADTLPGHAAHAHELENDDGLVTTLGRRSQRASHRKPFSSRRSEASLPPYSRHPPRPSPGSVNYEEDAETHKSYAESEASDITEKPSEASSSDNESQVSDSEQGDPYGAGASGGSSRPNSFSTNYAAPPGPTHGEVHNSWRRRAQGPHHYANNYTDSEQDSSHYATSLNGAVLTMNNMAGSRAPLPGFSSFV